MITIRFNGRLLLGFATLVALFCLGFIIYKSIDLSETSTNFQKKTLTDKDQDLNNADFAIQSSFEQAIHINFVQEFFNLDLFGAHSDDAVIIVVQLHDNAKHFKEFLKSLKEVKNIEKATFVLSIGYLSEELKEIISEIDFCRYMKIVFPFSKQNFPTSFPGEDPNDCPRDLPKNQAIINKCNNAECPDMYGHYREVKFVQMKHHWLWQFYTIFGGIRMFLTHKGPVVMLEENHYVLPDLLHCAEKAVKMRNDECPTCSFINLGNFEVAQNYASDGKMHVTGWTSKSCNMGLVLTRAMYEDLSSIWNRFCEFDDYNWAWSLQFALLDQLPQKAYSFQFKTTRVYRLGSCIGLKPNCALEEELRYIKSRLKDHPLFPELESVSREHAAPPSSPRANGGWGDIRDHALCKQYKEIVKSAAMLTS